MNKTVSALLLTAGLSCAAADVSFLGTDCRVGADVLRAPGCIYIVGGNNIGGKRQIRRIALDEKGMPVSAMDAGEIGKTGIGNCSAAISGKWLFIVGNALGDKAVRFTVGPDGTLSGRTELPLALPEPKALRESGLIASGRHLVAMGGWQTRQVYTCEVKADGTLAPWIKRRPLPSISFCHGRCFRIGERIYVSGNYIFKHPADRVYSTVVDAEGLPTKWQRWAELPEASGEYDFRPTPDGKRIFYRSGESGCMYSAGIIQDGEIGPWSKSGGIFPVENYVSLVTVQLNGDWILRYNNLSGDPRRFHAADLVSITAKTDKIQKTKE